VADRAGGRRAAGGGLLGRHAHLGAPRGRVAKKKTREAEEELLARVPHLQILHRQAGIASGASTCNGMVMEGVEFSRIARNAAHSGV